MFWLSWKEHFFFLEIAFCRKFSPSCSEIVSGLQPQRDSETWMLVVCPRFFSSVLYIYILLCIKILVFFWAQASSFVFFFQEVTCNGEGKLGWRILTCHADSWINNHVVISELKGGQSDSILDIFGRGKLVCDRTLLSAKKPTVVKTWMTAQRKIKTKTGLYRHSWPLKLVWSTHNKMQASLFILWRLLCDNFVSDFGV